MRKSVNSEAFVRPGRWMMLLVALVALCVLMVARPEQQRTSMPITTGRPHPTPVHRGHAAAQASHGTRVRSPSPTTTVLATHHDSGAPLSLPAEVTSSGAPTPTSTPTPTSISTSSITPTEASVAPTSTFNGWLEGPTSVSASYPVSSQGPARAAAIWTGASTLTLAATCGGSTTTSSGASGLSVELSAGGCTLTISGPGDVATTSFTISVGTP